MTNINFTADFSGFSNPKKQNYIEKKNLDKSLEKKPWSNLRPLTDKYTFITYRKAEFHI